MLNRGIMMAVFKNILILIFFIILIGLIIFLFMSYHKNSIKKAENVVKNEFNNDFDYKAEYTFGDNKK